MGHLSTMGFIFYGVSPFSVILSFLPVSPFWPSIASSRVTAPILLFCGGFVILGFSPGVAFPLSTLPLVSPPGGGPDGGLFGVTDRCLSAALLTRQRAAKD